MKKIPIGVSVALAITLLLFCSCSKKDDRTASAPPEQAAPVEKQITVRLLTDATGIDDKSF
ncbi:MAG: BMP family ABC transporter substrate-binding protein, partial [Treponema sp.]|nr:BMP family ABC transporter substrate-binding protein [Treponema sp.]